MKRYLLPALPLLTLLSLMTVNAEERPRLIHATYAIEREWKSPDDVVVPELDAYDFIYIMAGPQWTAEDFDMSQAEVNAKYVDSHEYAHPDGIAALIDGVHSQGGHILCSFPGEEFIKIAPDKDRADKFANMMVKFINKYGYDGVEVDWEHTVTEPLHLDFMKRIRRELNQSSHDADRQYWLTTALHSYRNYTPEMAAELSDCVDWINIMYYDMGGGVWGTSPTHNSPLDAMEEAHRRSWTMFDPSKLHVGMPSYGFYYKGIAPGETTAEGSTLKDYGRYCSYTELADRLAEGWQEVWDDKAKCQYYVSHDGNEFMTLESHRSLDEKFKWVTDHNFGGIFWWEYSYDWIKPKEGETRGRHLLTDHINEKIRGTK